VHTLKQITVILTVLFAARAIGDEIAISSFKAQDLSGWESKSHKGATQYTFATDHGNHALRAESSNEASALIKKIQVDTKDYPLLHWSWKIEGVIAKEDVSKKKGDDFAARVYVIFPRTFFWRMRAINYVWSSKMPKNSHVPSPYTANSVIVAVESGQEKVGHWLQEERNLVEDYRKFFHEDPPPIGAIAIMTDTDDTGEHVVAWYGDIALGKSTR
jgi:hypothetical protein